MDFLSGKGNSSFSIKTALSSADNSLQPIQIKQIGNDSGSLGTLNLHKNIFHKRILKVHY